MSPQERRVYGVTCRWFPAMEFGGEVDPSRPIRTVRDQAKWIGRIAVGAVIEITWDMQKQRRFARVTLIEYDVAPDARSAHVYQDGRAQMAVTLTVEPGLSDEHPDYAWWPTKTTELGPLRRD